MEAYETQSNILKALAHPTRLVILDALREGEQCVCHLEAALNLRQAYISQQLMILKHAELVKSRRDGLNLFYHVVKPDIYIVLDVFRSVMGIKTRPPKQKHANAICPCPKCQGR